MSIDLGLPALPPPTLAPRRKTRKIQVGKVAADINATLQQIAELTATGCDIVETLIEEAMRLAESMPAGDGAPKVSVG